MTHAALSDSARMIYDSAREFAEGSGGPLRARAMRERSGELDRRTWNLVLEMGWPLAAVAESHGGLGLGLDALAALAEGTSRMLLPEPLLSCIVASGLLSACASPASLEWLDQVVQGKCLAVPFFPVLQGRAPLELSHVPDCYPGTVLLVAKDNGRRFSIHAVGLATAGVSLERAVCVDGSQLARVTISTQAWEQSPVLAEGDTARAAHAAARDMALLGLAAALCGVMDEALQQSLEYMKVRQQFGQAIGTFQALQHRAASCHVQIQAARALVYEACKAGSSEQRARAACAAKARASAAALQVGKECVQFHGAIGFADEHNIGLYLRKAMTLAARMGGEGEQRRRYAALLAGQDR
jgi:alkylation response protein AidB-like acyl-CoA dehydrogenase